MAGMARRQWLVAAAISVAIVVALAAPVLVVHFVTPSPPGNRLFVRSVWLRHDGPFDPVRGQMSLDLIRKHVHGGMTPAQVRRLLGPPDEFGGRQADLPGSPTSYTIGAAPGFPGGEIDLVFRRGRLVRAYRFVCCGGL